MEVFQVSGETGITLKYSGNLLDSAVGLDAELLQPPTQFYVPFNTGATGLDIGLVLTGGTSSAKMQVRAVIITSGTLAGSDAAGILFIDHISGTITDTENLNNGITTYAIAAASQIDCEVMGLMAKSILLTVETNTIRINWTRQNPTNTAATPASFGHPMTPGQNIEINGYSNVRKFKMINAASANNSIVNITIKY